MKKKKEKMKIEKFEIKCRKCGSVNYSYHTSTALKALGHNGEHIDLEATYYHCNDCGEYWPLFKENVK